MMNDDIEMRLRQLMFEHLDISANQLQLDTSFSKQLGLDSLDAMDLLLAINESFGVRIEPEKMDDVDNLQQLIDVLKDMQSAS